MNFSKKFLIICLLAGATVLSGCGNQSDGDQPKPLYYDYFIDQSDTQQAKISIPGSWGSKSSLEATAQVTVKSHGISASSLPTKLKAEYDYQTLWEMSFDYTELWDQTSIDLGQLGTCAFSQHKIQFKADLSFDIGSADENGYFNVTAKNFKTDMGKLYMVCAGSFGTQTIEVPAFSQQTSAMFERGRVTNLTTEGADIIFPKSYIYESGVYKTVDKPIVIKIKKAKE
ncbi:MAG: hypothetical protein COU31_04345 [Candidatus Magasanikbacteria bacterium CG10_big_fil_rev_8_21_14_0_10_40_10]|uniref:Lipoprotein n=1 Tax=Candidatus Magasanikbacteria bacterium CG10_big_fil_rev_8_21_14_0_10_40_10 TaxID=1974648 RepID=A0A2M6W301_9BACT|nr:MAG: hypothetical protein COU31_04345 [Candidatus Magasanikbacteria bacterium CG10_big_fil_rev_8_21_14_0_10_40_10]